MALFDCVCNVSEGNINVNDELDNIWKEVLASFIMGLSLHLSEGLRKSQIIF
jgi:hypothetical protein